MEKICLRCRAKALWKQKTQKSRVTHLRNRLYGGKRFVDQRLSLMDDEARRNCMEEKGLSINDFHLEMVKREEI